MNKKGFKLSGPYGTFDDMTYGDKKNAFLAFTPVINIRIDNKITKQDMNGLTGVYTTEGVISVSGEMLVNFVEPMTKERIISRRII